MMECNKLIKSVLSTNVNCTQNVFEIFCLFANGIMSFEDVLDAAKRDNIDFRALCENCNVNYELISNRE